MKLAKLIQYLPKRWVYSMDFGAVVGLLLVVAYVCTFLFPPKEVSSEKKLGDAISTLLSKGIKVRIDKQD
jgi:hypothetical protein